MVEVVETHRVSEFRDENEKRSFPQDELSQIRQAIVSVLEARIRSANRPAILAPLTTSFPGLSGSWSLLYRGTVAKIIIRFT